MITVWLGLSGETVVAVGIAAMLARWSRRRFGGRAENRCAKALRR